MDAELQRALRQMQERLAALEAATAGHVWSTGPAIMQEDSGVTDHGALTGLADDDHAQYAFLAGRAGGQTFRGGTGAGDDLTLGSTAHATPGEIIFEDTLRIQSGAELQWDGGEWNIASDPGAAGEILTSGGPGVAPTWAPGVTFDGTMADNTAVAFAFHEGSNNYMVFRTSNGTERITIGSSSGTTMYVQIDVIDNQSQAFVVTQGGTGGNVYIQLSTINSSETLTLGNSGSIVNVQGRDNNANAFVAGIGSGTGAAFLHFDSTNTAERMYVGYTGSADLQVRFRAGSGAFWFDNGTIDARVLLSGSALILNDETNVAPQVTQMTTTQRDALTATNGMIIYNTTTTLIQCYENGAWRTI